MKKVLCYVLTIILMASSLCLKQNTCKAAEGDIEITSRSAILIEASTGQVLYEKNADEQLRPASVTKVMTLLLTFDELGAGNMTYSDMVTVSAHAASMGGSQCFFEEGEQQSVEDMIKCIEIASGNDAATAMAEHIAGSEEAFVNMMNERAKGLGMENSHFENACGLEAEGHVTSARDIALMSRELTVKHPDIFKYSNIWMDSIVHTTRRGSSRFDLANTNKFLKKYTGATGLKTGYTSQAKYCMSATASRNGIDLIAVIMGAETKEIRNEEACKLLDYGFANCSVYTDNEVLDENIVFPVKHGSEDRVYPKKIEGVNIALVDANSEDIKKTVVVNEKLEAPVCEGDTIGMVQYKIGDNVIKEVLIYADRDIKKRTYNDCFKKICRKMFLLTE